MPEIGNGFIVEHGLVGTPEHPKDSIDPGVKEAMRMAHPITEKIYDAVKESCGGDEDAAAEKIAEASQKFDAKITNGDTTYYMPEAGGSLIDDAYKKLLDTASNVKPDNDGKLSDDELNALADKLQEIQESDPGLSAIANLPSNQGVKETPIPAAIPEAADENKTFTADVEIDPTTGAAKVLGPADDLPDPDFNLEDYLDMKSYEKDYINLDKVELSESIRREYGITVDEGKQLLALLKRVQSNEPDIRYYDELPTGCKRYADAMAMASGVLNKAMQNTTAKSLIDMIFNEIAADEFQIDIENLINNEIEKSGADFSSVYSGMVLGKKEKLYEAADKIDAENPDKKENANILRQIGDACEESYKLTQFADAINHKKIRIRKIDVEKPEKVFRDFNMKYENSKIGINNISDITICIPRHLATATKRPTPDTVTPNTIIAFAVAFCKYCGNYSPSNVVQHTFMYYFIKNILHLDAVPPGMKFSEFAQELIDNIESILEDIHRVYGF